MASPAAVLAARTLLIDLKPVLDRGRAVRLDAGFSQVDLPSSEAEIASWITEHPSYRVSLRLGWPSKLVAVVPLVGDTTAPGGLAADKAPSFVPGDGSAARCYFYAMPAGVDVFGALTEQENVRVFAENDMVSLPASRAEWGELAKSAVPVIPVETLQRLGCRVVPVDGTPRFRELGRSGAWYPTWEAADGIDLGAAASACGDATSSVCCYVGPDHQSLHVCDLLIETDHEGDDALGQSIGDTKLVVRRFVERGVPPAAISVMYTGGKSIHVRVPYAAFGQVPGPGNNEVMRRVAERLLGGLVDFDRTLFNRRQKSRLVGTRHSGTGLFAVPVAFEELDTVTPDSLRLRARAAVERVAGPTELTQPIPALRALWTEELKAQESGGCDRGSRPTGSRSAARGAERGKRVAADRKAAQRAAAKLTGPPSCIQALVDGQVTPSNGRNMLGVALVAYARTRRLGDLGRRRLYKDAAGRIPSKDLTVSQRERRLQDADRSAARCKNDTYTFGARSCQVLRDAGLPCTSDCPFRALWKRSSLPGVRRPEPLPPGVEPLAVPVLSPGLRLEDVREAVRRAMADIILSPQVGGAAILIKAPPGIGKTTITLRELAAYIARELGGFRVLWVGDRHDLLDVVEAGIPRLVHIRPRCRETCARFEEIEAMGQAGWGALASGRVCGSCPHHPRQSPTNPCEFQRVLRDRSASWGVVHELLSLTDIASSFSFVVIDEDVVQSCIRERKYRPRDIERAAEELVATSQVTRDALRRVLRLLAQKDLGAKKLERRLLREAMKPLDVEQFVADVEVIDWSLVKPAWAAKLEESPGERDADGLTRIRRQKLPPNPRPLLLALRDLLLGKAAAVQWTGSAWRVKWIEPLRLGNRPVLVLDATADPALLERVLGRKVEVREFTVPFTAPVLQAVDGKYPRSTFFERGNGPRSLRPRILRRMLRLVAERAGRVKGRTLLVTYKALVDDPIFEQARASLPRTVDVAWYGNLRGMDHSGYSQIILLGFPFAPPDEIVFTAEAIYQGEEELSDETTEQIVPYLGWASSTDNPVGHEGGPVGLRVRRFMDPRVEQVRRLTEDAEYYQALNRIRQINDPTKLSVLVTSVPLDPVYGVPVRLVAVDDLMGQRVRGESDGNGLRRVIQDFLLDQGFIAAWAVQPANRGVGASTLQREVRRLALEQGLPRLTLTRSWGRGRNRVAYGDMDRCRRYDGVDAFVVTQDPDDKAVLDPKGVTGRNPRGTDYFSRAVIRVSYTGREKKSGSRRGRG